MSNDFIRQGLPQPTSPIADERGVLSSIWYRLFQALWTRCGQGGNNDVVFGAAAMPTTTTRGFLYLPSCAGPPTGTPNAYPGQIAVIYDSTNNRIYAYNGAWKKTAALT